MKQILFACLLAATGGCAHHIKPAVTQDNGDSVTIATQQHHKRRWALAAASGEADRVCHEGQGKRAEHASTRKDGAAGRNYDLFLCLN